MYTVKEIIPYALTRDIVLQDESKYKITAFDDSDIRGDDEFSFLKVGSSYNFKIGILGDVADTGKKFLVDGQQRIGKTSFVKLRDESGHAFYLEPDGQLPEKLGQSIRVEVKRYELLQVNDVIKNSF